MHLACHIPGGETYSLMMGNASGIQLSLLDENWGSVKRGMYVAEKVLHV